MENYQVGWTWGESQLPYSCEKAGAAPSQQSKNTNGSVARLPLKSSNFRSRLECVCADYGVEITDDVQGFVRDGRTGEREGDGVRGDR